MKVTKSHVPVFFDINAPFNGAMEGLVQDIFQHHSVGHIGYIKARENGDIATPKRTANVLGDFSENDVHSRLSRFDLADLGEYEKRIFSSLVIGKYPTTVLIGDMGSGKSATIEYLTSVLKRPRSSTCGLCENCSPIVIKMNFNAGFLDEDPAVVLRTFRRTLYDKLRFELRRLYKITFREKSEPNKVMTLTDALLDEIRTPGSGANYAAFDRFEQMHADIVTWNTTPTDVKADLLFSYVDDCTNNGVENLRVMMNLVHLTKKRLRSDPACLILVFDNIDSILPEAQYTILSEILQYQETAQVQSLVTLRRANFVRFEQNSAALSFGTVNHAGPDIKDVVMRRLKYYADNWDSLPEVEQYRGSPYLEAVKKRLDYLIKTESDLRGGIQRIAALCGASIRLGLFMSQRFFLNSAVKYDVDPKYKDDIVRALLIEQGESNQILPDDLLIANLFLNKATGEASLLNIRILQLVVELERDEPNRLSKLLEILKAIGFSDREEVVTALNYLLYLRRPLLWVDGRTKYDGLHLDRHLDDALHLTEAGYRYLRELVVDLVYVQEATLSVKWHAGNIPTEVDYGIAVQRFQVLRCFLEQLAEQDFRQTKLLKTWLGRKGASYSITPMLFVNRMISGLGKSALIILLQRIHEPSRTKLDEQIKHETLEELKNWQSMINVWLEKERQITRSAEAKQGIANKKLEQLSEEYRVNLMLKQ